MTWRWVVIGLIMGNFFFALLFNRTPEGFLTALERSVFQSVAIAVIFFTKPWED